MAVRSATKPEPSEPWIDWHVWLRVAAAAVILGAFVVWLWPKKDAPDGRVLSLDPGLSGETSESSARAGTTSLLPQATRFTFNITRSMVAGLGQIIGGKRSVKELGGTGRVHDWNISCGIRAAMDACEKSHPAIIRYGGAEPFVAHATFEEAGAAQFWGNGPFHVFRHLVSGLLQDALGTIQ